MQEYIYNEFKRVGEDLAQLGLTSSHGGNMSLRHQGKIVITTHFAMMGRLDPADLAEVPVREVPDSLLSEVSKDVALHQLIYRFTPAGAVIHVHPAHAVALSLNSDLITPRDQEGSVFLREIPVIRTEETDSKAPQLLQTHTGIMVRGHGSYVVGRTLTEALAYTSALGFTCKVAYLAKALEKDPAGQ
jgi:L-fuculose-phosphate aldolase